MKSDFASRKYIQILLRWMRYFIGTRHVFTQGEESSRDLGEEELFFRLSLSLLLFFRRSIRSQLPAHHNTSPPSLNLDCAFMYALLQFLLFPLCLLLIQAHVYELLITAVL